MPTTVKNEIDTIRAEIAVLLKTKESNVANRMIRMMIGPVCKRCNGSGNYSYNQVHGTMCYGCRGRRIVSPEKLEEWKAALSQANTAVAEGELDAYLAYLDACRITKNAGETILNAWKNTGITKMYDWHKSCVRDADGNHQYIEDCRIANANRLMAMEHQRIQSLAGKLLSSKLTREEKQAGTLQLAEAVQTALARIARAAEIHLSPAGHDPMATALATLLDAHGLAISCQSYGGLVSRGRKQPDSLFAQERLKLEMELEAAHIAAMTGENLNQVLKDLLDRTENSPASLLWQNELQDWKSLRYPLETPNDNDLHERVQYLREGTIQARRALELAA